MSNMNEIPIKSSKINVKELIRPYVKNWYWFVISLLLFGLLAYAYLRYSKPVFMAQSTIMIAEEEKVSPEASILEGLSPESFNSKKVDGEIQVLRSRELMQQVVEELGLNVQYFATGRINDSEIYSNPPFKVNYLQPDSIINNSSSAFEIRVLSNTSFEYSTEGKTPKKYLFGENVPNRLGNTILIPREEHIKNYIGAVVKVKVSPLSAIREYYRDKLAVTPMEKSSNIISVSLTDQVQKKAVDIVNKLVEIYNENSIEQKNSVAITTSEFIDERIKLVASDLSEVDLTKEHFKVGNKLTDITSEAGIFLETGAQTEQNLIQVGTELNTVNFMSEYVEDQNRYELLPTNIGLSDPNLSTITSKYNELILERQRLLKTSGENNPIVVQLDQQLSGLKSSMRQSLGNLKSTLGIKARNLRAQEGLINSRISSVPGQERKNRDIQRQQDIKEAIYLYLLQKREESAISMAATSPNATVIEPAYNSYNPVSSGKKIYMGAAFLGLLIPFGFIYIKRLFDTKIHKKADVLDEIPNISVIAQLPHIEKRLEKTIKINDRSVLAESFRVLRTNIDYMINKKTNDKGEVIYITSSIKGEGKSFVSYNLASIYAYSNKKVLLVGADIRKPSLSHFIKNSSKIGLSEYLHGDVDVEDIIKPVLSFSDLDVIQSGKIPPNSAELLMNKRLGELFDYAREHYDIIIVDTAPSMMVTDTVMIGAHADRAIYIVRAGYTDRSLLGFVKELYKDQKLKNMAVIVNDVKSAELGYGTRYGYGYMMEPTKKRRLSFR
ncbi:polysaccharide biosynthesis tyrosine autokinase [Galbibacter sp. EGI 63066]|uniref:GumC family protein n=1 Tax=Galbibacter sp. EGI 63066 TaxID=2993559 RepID=UPI002248D544|nr:tyrosine-protein kinase [Galbibacter sp. EGI 63066]MCX2679158.1 polysaccharide biosynthesis tyrosine autokinase [Galbibacter sp. EGI 63066]